MPDHPTPTEQRALDILGAEAVCNVCDEDIILLGNQWSCRQKHDRCTMQGCVPRKRPVL